MRLCTARLFAEPSSSSDSSSSSSDDEIRNTEVIMSGVSHRLIGLVLFQFVFVIVTFLMISVFYLFMHFTFLFIGSLCAVVYSEYILCMYIYVYILNNIYE